MPKLIHMKLIQNVIVNHLISIGEIDKINTPHDGIDLVLPVLRYGRRDLELNLSGCIRLKEVGENDIGLIAVTTYGGVPFYIFKTFNYFVPKESNLDEEIRIVNHTFNKLEYCPRNEYCCSYFWKKHERSLSWEKFMQLSEITT